MVVETLRNIIQFYHNKVEIWKDKISFYQKLKNFCWINKGIMKISDKNKKLK